MTTTVSRERPQSTKEMLAVHRVFRRESALMPRLVQAVPAAGGLLYERARSRCRGARPRT